jgi:hypothetical protein
MAASAAVPGLFFCFAATVLLVFVCVSSPTWERISFLDVTSPSGAVTHFGVFGYTGSRTSIGYNINAARLGVSDPRLNTTVLRNLTKVLILHPIAAGLAGLAFLFGLCGVRYHRSGTIMMSVFSALANLTALVVFVIDMVLWGIARNRLRGLGLTAQYGNANWLTLGAVVALACGYCVAACAIFGNYRRRRKNTY